MGGFAVSQGSALNLEPSMPVGADAPEPFWDAFRGAVGPNLTDAARSMEGMHEEDVRASLWARHREVERRTGQRLPLSETMLGEASSARDPLKSALDSLLPVDAINAAILGRPGALDDTAYEQRLDELRLKHPELKGVATRDGLIDGLAQRWSTTREEAQAAASKGPGGLTGALVGQLGGTMLDPRQAGLAVATGGWGAGRPIATRMLAQAGAGALSTGLAAGDKAAEAQQYGGPEYGAGEAATDIALGAAGGAAFEGLFSGARAALRLLPRDAADPALRGATHVIEAAERDEAILGGLAGEEFDRAAAALEAGAPAPRIEPARDLADLFSPEAGGGPDVAMYRGRPIYAQAFDPGELATDPGRFQYKAGGDDAGVTARLKGVEAWDPLAAGRVLIWEDRAGGRFVADGHQRFGLIRRLNDDEGFEHGLDGYLFREADGWRAQDVRTVAALKNIREGSGAPLDAAKVFRDAPDAIRDRSLPVTGDFMAQARGLAQLSDEAFGAVINRVIPERYAAEIGQVAATRSDLHMDMVRLMKAAAPANQDEARALVAEALQDDWIRTSGDQADLFGYDASQSAMIGRAKVAASVKRSLARDAKLFAQLVKNADAIEAGGNALARDANEARLALDRTALEVTAKLALRSGPIGEAMAAAAKKVAAGESPASAAKGVLARLREAIEAGERLDQMRGATLDPAAPTQPARKLLAGFDDPNGAAARAQAQPAPEDAAIELGPTGTPEFKAWFGESQVVAADGAPRVVYHGTHAAKFERFDVERMGEFTDAPSAREGFFFAGTEDTALEYAPRRVKASERARHAAAQEAVRARLLPFATELVDELDRAQPGRFLPRASDEADPSLRADRRSRMIEDVVERAGRFFEHAEQSDADADWFLSRALKDSYGGVITDDVISKVGSQQREALFEARSKVPKLSELEQELDADGEGHIGAYYLSLQNPLVHDFKGSPYREVTYKQLLVQAKEAGHDGAIFRNTFDGGKETGAPDDVIIAFSPDQIRAVDAMSAQAAADDMGAVVETLPEGPPPGLFDDLPETGMNERAHQALVACVPGE